MPIANINAAYTPLIRIGYWEFSNSFSKIHAPLFEVYKEEDITVSFLVSREAKYKLGVEDTPYDLTNVNITVRFYNSIWTDDINDIPLFEFTNTDDEISLVNPTKGLFSVSLSADQIAQFNLGRSWYVIFFTENGSKRLVLKDFIEIIDS